MVSLAPSMSTRPALSVPLHLWAHDVSSFGPTWQTPASSTRFASRAKVSHATPTRHGTQATPSVSPPWPGPRLVFSVPRSPQQAWDTVATGERVLNTERADGGVGEQGSHKMLWEQLGLGPHSHVMPELCGEVGSHWWVCGGGWDYGWLANVALAGPGP